mmetsp:Transcript_9365/g.26984  ORF Transcript_9365/g.26984 Transcript_9365/m.26984 type:complete len:92 (-) Transcript_9365:493-768(-)
MDANSFKVLRVCACGVRDTHHSHPRAMTGRHGMQLFLIDLKSVCPPHSPPTHNHGLLIRQSVSRILNNQHAQQPTRSIPPTTRGRQAGRSV